MRKLSYLALFISVLLVFTGCKSNSNNMGASNGRILPNITGGAGEILVVMDKFNWDHAAGEALRDILLTEVPALPQSEPMYDITQVTAASFDGFFQFHRTIILTTISSSTSEPKINYGKDVWARPQLVVEIKAASAEQLTEVITENHDQIIAFLNQYERLRLMDIYKASRDSELTNKILKDHKVSVTFPRGYNLDFSNDEYTSVSIETPDYSQVIQIYEYPAEGADALSSENLLAMRDKFTEKYVKGPDDVSYMAIARIFPPLIYDINQDQQHIVEVRGLWELQKGFMGGPFISHAIYDAARKRVVVIDGYLLYPNQKKRVKMRQLEAIVYSLKLV